MVAMTEVQLEWRAPSAPAHNGGRRAVFTDAIREALTSRPNEWAVVDSRTYATTEEKARLKNNFTARTSQWRKRYPSFEFAARIESEDSRVAVFARYVGA